jgi:NADP-dependent 3-hydroxy acid dehydrogenase YdfG
VDERGLAETATRARALGASVRSDRLDVVDRAAMLAYARAVVAQFGAVHVVINNAGVVHVGDVLGMAFADIERVMNVDFWGVVNGTKAFLPYLIATGTGTLVNVSSLFGLVPIPTQSAYNAAKYAVRGFTESLRIEMLVAGHPVRVC